MFFYYNVFFNASTKDCHVATNNYNHAAASDSGYATNQYFLSLNTAC